MTKDELSLYIIKRYDRWYDDQSNWRTLWQELADYVHTRKSGNITGKTSPGIKRTENLYDSTAEYANGLLAASMNGALTSSSVKWFSLRVKGIRETKEITDWLEDCSNKMYRALQQSNFNSEIHEVYLDLGAFGVSSIEIEENDIEGPGFNGLRFRAYCIGEYVVDEDADGRVNAIIRKFSLSNQAAYDKWGDAVSENIKEMLTTKPDDEIEILHAIIPMKAVGRESRVFSHLDVYINYKTKSIITQAGYREFPTPTPRWSKSSGEKYGRGPGSVALPDIKTLNKAVELGLKSWAKTLDPPIEVLDDGVVGSVKLQPAGITYVRNMGNIKPIPFGGDVQKDQLNKEDLKVSVRRIFFADQLQFQETPQMTATEVYVRYELMQRLLGPTLGRLESELFNPLIERVFNLMYRAGAFLPIPAGLPATIDIEYEGPMARAQKGSEVIAIQRTLELIGPMAQAKPEILDWYDMDKIAKFVPTVTGMPSSLLRSDAQVKQIRDVRAEEMAKQQQQQQLAALAEGAGKAAPMVKAVGDMMGKPQEAEAAK